MYISAAVTMANKPCRIPFVTKQETAAAMTIMPMPGPSSMPMPIMTRRMPTIRPAQAKNETKLIAEFTADELSYFLRLDSYFPIIKCVKDYSIWHIRCNVEVNGL